MHRDTIETDPWHWHRVLAPAVVSSLHKRLTTKALLINLFTFPRPSQVLELAAFLTGLRDGLLSLMAGELCVFISQVITFRHQLCTGQLGQGSEGGLSGEKESPGSLESGWGREQLTHVETRLPCRCHRVCIIQVKLSLRTPAPIPQSSLWSNMFLNIFLKPKISEANLKF